MEKDKIQDAEVDVKKIIKDLGDTNFSGSNDEQGKMVALLKGLAFSDDPLSNKFMKALDKATTEISKEVLKDVKDSKRIKDGGGAGVQITIEGGYAFNVPMDRLGKNVVLKDRVEAEVIFGSYEDRRKFDDTVTVQMEIQLPDKDDLIDYVVAKLDDWHISIDRVTMELIFEKYITEGEIEVSSGTILDMMYCPGWSRCDLDSGDYLSDDDPDAEFVFYGDEKICRKILEDRGYTDVHISDIEEALIETVIEDRKEGWFGISVIVTDRMAEEYASLDSYDDDDEYDDDGYYDSKKKPVKNRKKDESDSQMYRLIRQYLAKALADKVFNKLSDPLYKEMAEEYMKYKDFSDKKALEEALLIITKALELGAYKGTVGGNKVPERLISWGQNKLNEYWSIPVSDSKSLKDDLKSIKRGKVVDKKVKDEEKLYSLSFTLSIPEGVDDDYEDEVLDEFKRDYGIDLKKHNMEWSHDGYGNLDITYSKLMTFREVQKLLAGSEDNGNSAFLPDYGITVWVYDADDFSEDIPVDFFDSKNSTPKGKRTKDKNRRSEDMTAQRRSKLKDYADHKRGKKVVDKKKLSDEEKKSIREFLDSKMESRKKARRNKPAGKTSVKDEREKQGRKVRDVHKRHRSLSKADREKIKEYQDKRKAFLDKKRKEEEDKKVAEKVKDNKTLHTSIASAFFRD